MTTELGPVSPDFNAINGRLDIDNAEDWKPAYLRGRWGMLSDEHIMRLIADGIIGVDPTPNLSNDLDSCKLTLHIGNKVNIVREREISELKLREKIPSELIEEIELTENGISLKPGDHIVALTQEKVTLPNYLIATMDGKSGNARQGIIIHQAGIVDAGWSGQLAMEIVNLGRIARRICLGDKMCVLTFELLTSPARKPYDGHFQGQTKPIL